MDKVKEEVLAKWTPDKVEEVTGVPEAQVYLVAETMAVAAKIAEKSQLAAMAAKEAVHRADEVSMSEGVLFERRMFQALFSTQDQKEGMLAFLEKRPARFTDS